jgi:hypothetical protein
LRGDDLLLAHLAILFPGDDEEGPSPQERLAEALDPELAESLVARLTERAGV